MVAGGPENALLVALVKPSTEARQQEPGTPSAAGTPRAEGLEGEGESWAGAWRAPPAVAGEGAQDVVVRGLDSLLADVPREPTTPVVADAARQGPATDAELRRQFPEGASMQLPTASIYSVVDAHEVEQADPPRALACPPGAAPAPLGVRALGKRGPEGEAEGQPPARFMRTACGRVDPAFVLARTRAIAAAIPTTAEVAAAAEAEAIADDKLNTDMKARAMYLRRTKYLRHDSAPLVPLRYDVQPVEGMVGVRAGAWAPAELLKVVQGGMVKEEILLVGGGATEEEGGDEVMAEWATVEEGVAMAEAVPAFDTKEEVLMIIFVVMMMESHKPDSDVTSDGWFEGDDRLPKRITFRSKQAWGACRNRIVEEVATFLLAAGELNKKRSKKMRVCRRSLRRDEAGDDLTDDELRTVMLYDEASGAAPLFGHPALTVELQTAMLRLVKDNVMERLGKEAGSKVARAYTTDNTPIPKFADTRVPEEGVVFEIVRGKKRVKA